MGAVCFAASSCCNKPDDTSVAVSGALQTGRYRGTWHAITDIIRKEGVLGMTRGMHASIMRVMVGSASQLSSYSSCKAAVLSTGLFEDNVYA